MPLDKPYLDVPGTTIFDAEQSRKGYWLNQFCMSLMKADNRARFKAGERAYLDEWAMTEDQKRQVEDLVNAHLAGCPACRRYLAVAPRDFITFEYAMLDGVNDDPRQADALLRLTREVPCKFNLIPFNPFPGAPFAASSRARIAAFQRRLMDAGIVATIRKTRGDDIDAACGQLAGVVHNRVTRPLATRPIAVRTLARAR